MLFTAWLARFKRWAGIRTQTNMRQKPRRPTRKLAEQAERLEDRTLLAAVTVDTTADTIDGVTTSIANLIASPGTDGNISLREAIVAANNTAGADTISFDPSINGNTITLSIAGTSEDAAATGDLDITDALTITGNGRSSTIIDANGIDRVFHILADNVTISDMTVTGGDESQGAGLRIEQIAVLNNLLVEGSVTGGGIYMRNVDDQ